MRGADLFFELIKICNDCNLMLFFELSKTVMEKSLAGHYFFEITDIVFSGGGKRSWRTVTHVKTFRADHCEML